jgi:methyl-accepting chemotaxis protein
MRLTISKKLGAGFGALIIIIAVLSGVLYFQISSSNKLTHHVLEQNVPSVEHAIHTQAEIHNSLSMHRGYMILGLKPLADERIQAWKEIDEHTTALEELSHHWKDQETLDAFAEFKTVMGKFKKAQDEIARVAHTPEDNLAETKYFNEAMPHGEEMVAALEHILVLEREIDATNERKLLVEYVAAAKGHMLRASQAITAFLVSGTEEQAAQIKQEVADCQASVDRLKTKTDMFTPEQKTEFDRYIAEREKFLALAFEVVDIRSGDDWCKSEYICLNQVAPLSAKADELLSTIISLESEAEKKAASDLTSTSDNMIKMLLTASAVGIGLGLFIAVFLSRQITKALNQLIDRVKDIAQGEGDLTKRIDVKSQDEIGELAKWFNAFVVKIHDVIAEVTDASTEVAAASTEIAASAEQIAAGANEQSQQITQVSSAVEEMSSSVVEVARKSADAANSANESGRIATEGGDVVTDTITGMRSINEAVSSSAQSVQELGKRGEQIGEVITVINDIADQTNLLALNAAIEAARAGEHGRGFAVVADEVRKLADRTTKATEEIAGSIQAIQNETTIAVDKMNAGTEEVTTGVQKAEQAGEALKQIVASAQDVSAMVQSIAAAAEEQSAASEQVSRNIEQIASVTRETSEGTNQAAAAATQLSQRAETLQQLVGQFKTDRG